MSSAYQELLGAHQGVFHAYRELCGHLVIKGDFRLNRELRQHVKKLDNELASFEKLLISKKEEITTPA